MRKKTDVERTIEAFEQAQADYRREKRQGQQAEPSEQAVPARDASSVAKARRSSE